MAVLSLAGSCVAQTAGSAKTGTAKAEAPKTGAPASGTQLPSFYKTANRVTWIVENIDHARPAWEALGLTDIQEFPNVELKGTYEGKPTTINLWEITGRIGNLTVDMIQPGEGELNAYTHFLDKHGDGIFSIVHEVATKEEMLKEIARMKSKGVGVLQQVTMPKQGATFTYFDTEVEGKFNLGLVYRPGGMKMYSPGASGPAVVQHFGFSVKDLPSVSDYWAKLGFPALKIGHNTPRADSTYKGKPLSLAFDEASQRYDQFGYTWIAAPPTTPNLYSDYLKLPHHREGIQHIAITVDDLQKTIAMYEKLGYHVEQSGTWGDPSKKGSGAYVYMDTEKIGGLSVGLLHSN